MIDCYCKQELYQEALQLFEEMNSTGTRPDVMTMATVISACAHLGALDKGKEMHLYVLQTTPNIDVYLGSALIDMYAKCGVVERALVVFFKLQEKNLFCWSSVIDGLAYHGYAEEALEASLVPGVSGTHPLLAPCLNRIGKFAHLIDLDFMADLMQCLRKLAGNGSKLGDSLENSTRQLTVSERLHCCVVAFKVMRINLDALDVDLQEFFVQFYNLILEYRPGRDEGEVLAEALKIMLCDERQHDMLRAAAFIKRLATFSLCFRSAESMAVKNLLQKNAKCRNLLENDAGGGSVAGAIAKFQPHVLDPNLSGALASVLWELNLLMEHYHPAVSSIAYSISTMNSSTSQIYHSHANPQQAYMELSKEKESFAAPSIATRANHKKKRSKTVLSF